MTKISDTASPFSSDEDNLRRIERNYINIQHDLDQRLESIERTLNKLSHHISSLDDSISYIARIPNRPLELYYDHQHNILWAETRRKLQFTKNEAAIMSLLFTKTTGRPKATLFQCSEVAENMEFKGEGMETMEKVFETAARIQKKLDAFLNTTNFLVVTRKSFHLSKITL